MSLKDNKGIQQLLTTVEKAKGKGAIMLMGEGGAAGVEIVSTGSVGLDLALGVGGYPRGRIVEIYGPESSGKTTLTLHAIAEMQKQGITCGFIDAEHAFDPAYAQQLGVDIDQLVLSQPSCGEDGLDIAGMMARSGEIGLVVVDSVAALTPRAEIEGDMDDAQVGLQARMMGKALRKLTAVAHETNTTIIFINQLRQKIGVMFGSNETTTGGNALKFYASVRLDVRRAGKLTKGEELIGARTRVRVVKNKLAPPFKKAEFDLMYGTGVCVAGELLDLGVSLGIVEKSGSWYAWAGERLGQGRDQARAAILGLDGAVERLRASVLAACGVGTEAKAASDAREAA